MSNMLQYVNIYIFNMIYKDVQAMYVPNMLQCYNLEKKINKRNQKK